MLWSHNASESSFSLRRGFSPCVLLIGAFSVYSEMEMHLQLQTGASCFSLQIASTKSAAEGVMPYKNCPFARAYLGDAAAVIADEAMLPRQL